MGAGHTDGQARPSQLEVGAGVLGGLRVRWDPAPGPLTVGHVRPAGVFFSSGPRWRAARQLTVRALHGLGVGRAPVAAQSCPTLCDPMNRSTPGSPVPGIIQARTLEWVAISFSNA